MLRSEFATSRRVEPWRPCRRPRRPIAALLVLVLAVAVAACGASTSGGGQTVPTPKPSATATPTATPAPCAPWRVVSSPNATHYQMNVLTAVSALSPTEAWAVGGNYAEGGPMTSLIEQWDGVIWRVVANPGTDILNGVAAVSATDVWAVGATLNYGVGNHPNTPLIVHWNGSAWSIVPSAVTAFNAAQLDGAAAIGPNDVWAVGRMDAGSAHLLQPLVERWDGAAWRLVSGATPPGASESALTAVAPTPGTGYLWAVGSVRYSTPPSYFQPLVERWDGTAWQVVAGPTLPSGALGGTLSGVVALSPADAWAVGDYTASDHTIRALIAHWDGSAWRVVSSPDAWGSLTGVAAARANDVRAIGHSLIGDSTTKRAMILQWDGVAWKVAASPTVPGAGSSTLSGIATDGAGNFWAVGTYRNAASVSRTLMAHCP